MNSKHSRPGARQPEKALLRFLAERGTSPPRWATVVRAMALLHATPEAVSVSVQRLVSAGRVDLFRHGRPVQTLPADGAVSLRLRAAAAVDYRAQPHLYRVGRGEEGVLTVEPYKSELLPLWRFATEEAAERSASALWKRFRAYGKRADFVGMDMARKFLQMGWTRARRYANHRGGRKYAPGTREILPLFPDAEKARAAAVFRERYEAALADARYQALREEHERRQRGAQDAAPPAR